MDQQDTFRKRNEMAPTEVDGSSAHSPAESFIYADPTTSTASVDTSISQDFTDLVSEYGDVSAEAEAVESADTSLDMDTGADLDAGAADLAVAEDTSATVGADMGADMGMEQ